MGEKGRNLVSGALVPLAFVPGAAFHPRGGGAHTFRLNFTYCTPDVIVEGIRRLGAVLERHL